MPGESAEYGTGGGLPRLVAGYAESARLVQDAGDRVGSEVLAAVRVVGVGVGGAPCGDGVPHPFLDQPEPVPEGFHVGGHGSGDGVGSDGVRHGWRSPLRRRRAGAGPRSRGPASPPSGPGSVVSV